MELALSEGDLLQKCGKDQDSRAIKEVGRTIKILAKRWLKPHIAARENTIDEKSMNEFLKHYSFVMTESTVKRHKDITQRSNNNTGSHNYSGRNSRYNSGYNSGNMGYNSNYDNTNNRYWD